MRNRYNDKELADQLQLDLAEGESWHIEFKDYDYSCLDEKIADSWKDDLSHELAAFASIGGKIYIGISDDRIVKGIGGPHQAWQEKLFERAMGRIKPKVYWKSYHFVDSTTGTSRPAEPEEVKARFKEYFANREPILETELEPLKNDNREQIEVVSWITNVLMSILSSLNLYEQKEVDPQLERLKIELESSRDSIESNLNKVKRTLGENSNYYQELESISSEILSATKVRFFIDGGKSWSEWLSHLNKIHDTSSELLSTIRSSVSITIEGLNEQEEDAKDATIRWLNSIDDFSLNKFIYEANHYVHMLLHLYFLLWLSNEEQKANQYKEIADEIEKLSWARDNVGYWAIQEAIPELQQKLNIS